MTEQKRFLTTGLKITIFLIAVLAIGYTQTLVESWGGGYGGSQRQLLITQIEDRLSSDITPDIFGSFEVSNLDQWISEHGEVLILALALLTGLYLWHTLWAAAPPGHRLAAELQPMTRRVSRSPRLTKKHKRRPNGAPAWH